MIYLVCVYQSVSIHLVVDSFLFCSYKRMHHAADWDVRMNRQWFNGHIVSKHEIDRPVFPQSKYSKRVMPFSSSSSQRYDIPFY